MVLKSHGRRSTPRMVHFHPPGDSPGSPPPLPPTPSPLPQRQWPSPSAPHLMGLQSHGQPSTPGIVHFLPHYRFRPLPSPLPWRQWPPPTFHSELVLLCFFSRNQQSGTALLPTNRWPTSRDQPTAHLTLHLLPSGALHVDQNRQLGWKSQKPRVGFPLMRGELYPAMNRNRPHCPCVR